MHTIQDFPRTEYTMSEAAINELSAKLLELCRKHDGALTLDAQNDRNLRIQDLTSLILSAGHDSCFECCTVLLSI